MDTVSLKSYTETILKGFSSLSFWGNICSIVGLGVTIYVLHTLKSIKNRFMFTARVPESKERLQELASKIIDLHKDYAGNTTLLEVEVAKIEAVVNSLDRKVNKKIASTKNILKLITDFHKIDRTPQNNDQKANKILEIYTEIQKVLEEIAELEKDSIWER